MTLQASTQQQLRQFVEQVERLDEERKAIAADIRDKFTEMKALGFDVKAVKKVIQLRKKSQSERQEEDAILDVYLHALGMTPIEVYARDAAERELEDAMS